MPSPIITSTSTGASSTPSSSVCLVMIVKNEGKILRESLRRYLALGNLIKGFFLCDTGSEDDTVSIVSEFYDECRRATTTSYCVPKDVCQVPFKNFGFNRRESWKRAREFLRGCGQNLEDWYFLFMDADMELCVLDNAAVCQQLTREPQCVVSVEQQHGSALCYFNIRLVHGQIELDCVGSTHEYWKILPDHSAAVSKQLSSDVIFIKDHGNGGCKADKFRRDIRLLEEEVKQDPTNRRAWFYLGNSLRDVQQYEKAIAAYESRIELGGWEEEVYCSYLYMGRCNQQLKRYALASTQFWNAISILKDRCEAYYSLAECLFQEADEDKSLTCNRKKIGLACALLETAHRLGESSQKSDHLFQETCISKWKTLEKLTIVTYYHPSFRHKGLHYCDLLLSRNDIPDHLRKQTITNRTFFSTPV